MKEKWFVKYSNRWYEVPKTYYKRIQKILKLDTWYLFKNGWSYYYVIISTKQYNDFVMYQPYNKQCTKYNVDFAHSTMYMLNLKKTQNIVSEVNIDTFNKYAKKKRKYYIKSIENTNSKNVKIVMEKE